MCGSGGFGGDCCCCPPSQVFQEKICGNLTGALTDFLAWQAPLGVNDYFQGTFEIFNAGPGIITAVANGGPGNLLTIPSGTSQVVSINLPTNLTVTVPLGTTGKFCINLYKRVSA